MEARKPISDLLQGEKVSKDLKGKLERAELIRVFASDRLNLPENGSYRSYVELDREAVVWSVVATPALSFTPQQWCYLVIGCASYRGYFQKEVAEKFAAGLISQGLDVSVEPVPAYSTLGWFDDPLLSSVVHWQEPRLAGLMFHELAHQQLYIKGDSAFNEAFASTVERIGVEQWLHNHGDRRTVEIWQQNSRQELLFIGLLKRYQNKLQLLYAGPLGEVEMLQQKKELFDALRLAYGELKAGWGGYGGFDGWFERPLNNARLASVATYREWVPAFEQLWFQSEKDMSRFYQACEALGDLPMGERREQMQRLKNLTVSTLR
ncbi:MAG: aminopeptidase [Gammaproteobacteria bacterium]|nr:aminopeptidase [Gammaproteobacteria bacterium]